jgi:hypothetical protein
MPMPLPSDLANAFIRFNSGFAELTLREMLRDPIVLDLMKSDGVTRGDVVGSFKSEGRKKFRLAA